MQSTSNKSSWQPEFVASEKLADFIASRPGITIVDEYRKNLEELFLLRNPKYRFNKNYSADFEIFFESETKGSPNLAGNWFYYPWLNQLIHFLPDAMHQELRTGRNRNLITEAEQDKFYKSVIVVFGMSVGSHCANVIAMIGGAREIRIADPDNISGDNLNRIRAGAASLGTNKAIVVARQIYEFNPHAEVKIFTDGVNEDNAKSILNGVNLVIEEMDHPYWKLKIRELAKERSLPVVMGTDNGDGAIVDIERYDLDKNYPMLHGVIGDLTPEKMKAMDPKDWPKIAARVAGANLAVPRMLDSVAEVGGSLYSWPQLGTAANLCGSVTAYLARKIILKDPLIKSGRYVVSLDSIFESGYKRRWLSRKIAFFKFVRKMMKQKP